MSTPTPQQSRALDIRDVSVALASGAGCGKTYVLTERFLSHLDPNGPDAPHPADVRELVAITFTDAAAREMRTRIRTKCRERLEKAPTTKEQDGWLRLLRTIDTAPISTIHSFCASLLRDHAIEAGLDPTFSVLDQTNAYVLQTEVIDDVLRTKLAGQDERVMELAAAYGLGRLKSQLRQLLGGRNEQACFEEWRGADPDKLVAAWRRCYDSQALPAALREVAEAAPIDQIIDLLRSVEPRKQSFADARSQLLELLPKLRRGDVTPDDLQAILDLARVKSADGPFICTAKDWPGKGEYEQYRDTSSALRTCIESNSLKPFDEAAARPVAALGLSLLSLAEEAADMYQRRKDSQGMLDFDDLLAEARRLLVDPRHAAIRERLSAGIRLLLVDEFQDTDRLQVELVLALCGKGFDAGRLFFVGDLKQSIYRFRGAQPEVFRDLQSKVPESGRLPLTVNFRSQPAILNFVNALFCDSFAGVYDPLLPNRDQTTPEPAVEFLWTIVREKDNRTKGSTEAARRQEARWIARRLRQLIDSRQPLIVDGTATEAHLRPLKLGDVAILFRALSDVQLYEEALREYDLDYYLVGGHAFYSQQEVFDVLNLLRAVASTADQISLAGVLRSPFFSLADETLFWLVESAGNLNTALQSETLPVQLSPEERAKTAAAAETIQYLRQRKDVVPIAELLGEALARTGYDAVLLAEFLGERKLANLHKLVESARAADHGGVLDLDGFITQLSQFVAEQPKEALAATCPESADVIRLMTIHYAKGLEFPLVVVPDLDRQSGFQRPAAALDQELGPLVPQADDQERKTSTVGFDLYCALEKRADAEERARLLYVACTRAADYLILSSSLAGYDQLKSDWMKLVARRFDLHSGKLTGSLPPGYNEPRVHVTDQEPATDHRPAGKSRGPDLVKMLDKARREAAAGPGVVPPTVGPVAVDHAARQQFSFSRLTGQLILPLPPGEGRGEGESPDNSTPSPFPLPRQEGVDPRGLGSLVHAVLERADIGTADPIGTWCEQLAEEHVVANVPAAAELARDMVQRFTTSARWRGLAEAAAVHRELEFLLAWPPARYLQGFIDCLYQDQQGDWHVVDYKTNNVTADACPQEARRYEMQLYVYAMAVERALGRGPVELVLCFLRPGVEHIIAWNDQARRRGIAMVNQAMETIAGSAVGAGTRHTVLPGAGSPDFSESARKNGTVPFSQKKSS